MEKKCTKCNTSKPLKQFYKNAETLYGVTSYCKQCIKDKTNIPYQNDKNFRQKRLDKGRDRYYNIIKDGLHHVYLIPKDNYVGTSEQLKMRLAGHRYYGRDTTGWRILYSTKNRDEALELESLLHDLGYNGRHNRNTYK